MTEESTEFVVRAQGHENVTAEHASTFEVTSDDFLTPAGDCILGIEADTVPTDLDEAFVAACQRPDATIEIRLAAGGQEDVIRAEGHPGLSFENDRSMVVRTSDYVDDRTIAVNAEKAAGDIDRKLATVLSRGAALTMRVRVE
jgi:hypothetical protein